jgi:hypothetical protein
MPRLFVDLDGVLADFDAGARDALGMSCQAFQELHGAAVMWKCLQHTPEFYDRLDWLKGGKTLWRKVNEESTWPGPPPTILSGLPLGEWAQPQKRAWCARELGDGVPVILCMSIDKHQYCVAGDILIDDRENARLDWETAGGRFILHQTATESIAALRQLVTEPQEGTP